MRTIVFALVVASAAFVFQGCSASGPTAPPGGAGQAASPPAQAASATGAEDAKLFETSCSTCHPVARTTDYTGSESWADLVTEMIDEKGARISAPDKARIIAYLEATYPRS